MSDGLHDEGPRFDALLQQEEAETSELTRLRERLAAALESEIGLQDGLREARARCVELEAEAKRVHSVRYDGALGEMRTRWLDAQQAADAARKDLETALRLLEHWKALACDHWTDRRSTQVVAETRAFLAAHPLKPSGT